MKIQDQALITILLGQQLFLNGIFLVIPIPFLSILSNIILSFFVFRLGFKTTFVLSSITSIFELIQSSRVLISGMVFTESLIDPLMGKFSKEIIMIIHTMLKLTVLIFIPIGTWIMSFLILIGLAYLLKRFKFYKRIQGGKID